MKAERCVVDTNVLISAMLQPSDRVTEVWNAIFADGMLVLSDATFAALPVRLMRRKFDRYANAALRFVPDLGPQLNGPR